MSEVIRLRFEFHKKPDGSVRLEDYRPFPAEVLPAMLLMTCSWIIGLDLPDDNKYKVIARHILKELQ